MLAMRVATALLATMLAGGLHAARAQGPTPSAGAVNGFSTARLAHIEAYLKAGIAKGEIPGAAVTIVRGDKVAYQKFLGVRDAATKQPMTADTIFRIYSMTKPITTVAAMMLVEEGKLSLDEPVSKYIPAFANVKVGVEKQVEGGARTLELVPPRRPVSVQDLMRHTSGLTYAIFGESLVKKAYVEAKLGANDPTTEEFANRLAALPLMYQPGTTWEYSHATDVLGRIVEVISGKPFSTVLKERIFDPLGMKDTSFYVTDPAKHARIAEPLPSDRTIGTGVTVGDPRKVAKWESGGGGLVSTTSDYMRFLQMLLNGGVLDGKRYLGPRTIAMMTANHIGPASGVQPGPAYIPGPGYGFGLGFAVRTDLGTSAVMSSVGEYNWGGVAGTSFWVDPQEKMYVLFMIQAPSQRIRYRSALRSMIYGAMER